MIENASDLTKILERIDPSWGKFGSPSTRDTLFGEDFQSSLTSKVKKDTSLSKAASDTRESKRGAQFCIRKERQRSGPFLRGPSCEVWEQAGQEPQPHQNREGEFSRGRRYFNT